MYIRINLRIDVSLQYEQQKSVERREVSLFYGASPRLELRNGRGTISEMPVLFHANSAINFRFLRARAAFLRHVRRRSPVARREICGMSRMVSPIRASRRGVGCDLEITFTVASLLSRYLDDHYKTAWPSPGRSVPFREEIRPKLIKREPHPSYRSIA